MVWLHRKPFLVAGEGLVALADRTVVMPLAYPEGDTLGVVFEDSPVRGPGCVLCGFICGMSPPVVFCILLMMENLIKDAPTRPLSFPVLVKCNCSSTLYKLGRRDHPVNPQNILAFWNSSMAILIILQHLSGIGNVTVYI